MIWTEEYRKEKNREYSRKWAQKNKEKIAKSLKERRKNDPVWRAKQIQFARAYAVENREKVNEYMRKYSKLYRASHPEYVEKCNARKRRRRLENGNIENQRRRVRERAPEVRARIRSQTAHLRLYKKYGISLEEKNRLVEARASRCDICNKHSRLVVDHKHNGEKNVRGLLCSNCNTGIGLLYEDKETMARAILYLSK